jgi:hypothetical protein
MATDCSLLSAFVFTSKPLGRKHAVGVSKSSELFRVSAPTHKHPTGMPDGPPLRRSNCFPNRALVAKIHASCTTACLPTLMPVWGGARWLGVWDARLGSAQRSSMGVGAVRRIRTAPIQQTNNWPKRTPPMSTGLQAIDSEDTNASGTSMGPVSNYPSAPCVQTSSIQPP